MLKRLLIVMACLLFVVGCATVGIQPEVVPEGCEDSLIYKYMPSPKVTDTLLQVAMYNVVVEAPKSKADVLNVIAKLDAVLLPIENGATTLNAADFVALVMQEVSELNNRWGVSLLIIGQSIGTLSVPSPLTQCDARLIRAHLAKQKQWVSMVE